MKNFEENNGWKTHHDSLMMFEIDVPKSGLKGAGR